MSVTLAGGPLAALEALIESGEMRPDKTQRAAVERLEELSRRIDAAYRWPAGRRGDTSPSRLNTRGNDAKAISPGLVGTLRR